MRKQERTDYEVPNEEEYVRITIDIEREERKKFFKKLNRELKEA